jgi:proline iminopeptidase
MRARIRDTEIFFDIDGLSLAPEGKAMRERPTAFLVPGGPGTDHTGAKVRYGALASKMQMVFFDHRGQGLSARGDQTRNNLDENVEDMEALRRYLGLGPIVSIGVSYGGMVALAHALRYPRSISHLVLVATVAHSGYVERARQIAAEHGTAEQIAECDNLFCGRIDTPEKMRRYFEVMGPLYSRTYTPGQGVGLGATQLEPQPLNLAHGPSGFLRSFDLRPELPRIAVPTLILAGRHDWICAPEFSEEMHRLIPGSDLRIFEQSSHSIGADEPQQMLDAIAGFLVYRHAVGPR